MRLRAVGINLVFVLLVLLKAYPLMAEEREKEESEPAFHRGILLPVSNPLRGFDSNLFAWHSSTELLFMGGEWLDKRACLSYSKTGRFSYLLLSTYMNWATSYYSHEIAHQFLGVERPVFRVDMKDWYPYLVPEFVFSPIEDFWSIEEFNKYQDGDNEDYITKAIYIYESGLYQQKMNSRFAARNSHLVKGTSVNNALQFIINDLSDFAYLLYGRDRPITVSKEMGYTAHNYNDVNGYVSMMKFEGRIISSDDWLISSGLAFFASGQTWNSFRALYHYFMSGEKQVENLSFKPGERYEISLPNFYLFPTVRGLYLETECFVHSGMGGGTYRLGLGTGLDSFGLNQTGPVDWLRVGGAYYSHRIGIPRFPLTVSPFCYFNFDRSMKHRGQSLGFELQTPSWRSFSLYARLEHNSNDIEEQLIKNKEEGIYILTALEINM
ncbi:MAG: hypothetical protein GF417_05235 [Candidatus Latescibacteria bacterium]|nr:hypothetical protein [Candidatus Latescibacterota bacterium]